MAVVPSSQDLPAQLATTSTPQYPFSDPIFQLFNVQQYLTVSGVSTGQLYDVKAPELPEEPAKEEAGK